MSATQVKLLGFQTLMRIEKKAYQRSFIKQLWIELVTSFLTRFLKGFPTAWGGLGAMPMK
jgi:hypothetical protein